jgi:hypothetical protein
MADRLLWIAPKCLRGFWAEYCVLVTYVVTLA